MKTEWLNRRLRVNLAAFYQRLPSRLTSQAGFQCLGESTSCRLAGCWPLSVRRAEPSAWGITIGTPAEIEGVELELTAEPIDGLLFNLAGGYNHFINGVKTPGEPGYLAPGNLPQPEVNASAGLQYAIPFFGGTLTPRIDANYMSKQTFVFQASRLSPTGPLDTIEARTIFNASLGYSFGDAKSWSAVLSATNVTDKYYFHTLFWGSTVATAGVIAAPREISLNLRKSF